MAEQLSICDLISNASFPVQEVMLMLLHAMTFGQIALNFRTESMHGAGSPMAQKIMIERQTDRAAKVRLARSLAGIDQREDVTG